jgi:class 3 adenylate cyclase
MRRLPTGTVTLLFKDIEGSTRLLQELGDAYAGGLNTDAFCVRHLCTTEESRSTPRRTHTPIRVRIGLHSGEPVVTDDGYFVLTRGVPYRPESLH